MTSPGTFTDGLRQIADSVVGVIATRIELLAVEWETERTRLRRLLVATLVMVFSAAMCVLVASAWLMALLWETHRLAGLAILAALFAGASVIAWRIALRLANSKPGPFAATLSALADDRRALRGRHVSRSAHDGP